MAEIKKDVYLIFYEKLLEKFIAVIKSEKKRYCNTSARKEVWSIAEDNNKIYFVTRILKDTGITDIYYFYKREKACQKKRTIAVQLKDDVVISALLFLGFSFPETISSSIEERREFLQNAFEHKYCKDIAFAQGEVKTRPLSEPILLTEKAIRDFYYYIGQKDFKKAWALLTPEFKASDRWKKSFKKFYTGYTNTLKIYDITLYDFDQNLSGIDCEVTYEDVVRVYHLPEIKDLYNVTIKDAQLLFEGISKLKQKFKRFKKFEEVSIQMLFHPTASEHIWSTAEMPPQKLKEIFGVAGIEKRVKRTRSFTCIKSKNGQYLIQDIKNSNPTPITL